MNWKVAALSALVLAGCTGSPAAITTSPPANPPAAGQPTSEPTSVTPPVATAPKPITLKGTGSRVLKVTLAADSPLVVTASNSGSSNFVVELFPPDGGQSDLLINEIGPYSGQAAKAQITSGTYRLKVDAEGPWRVRLEQPVPTTNAKAIPGRFTGKGAKVIPIQVVSDIQPTVTATHRGQSNFIVDLIGYGDLTGDVNVFNEIGNFHGQTVTDQSLTAGGYLLYVQADGSWTLDFAS